ncbi:hypothetical protein C0992_006940 [Termitomyces sp. T32_za158]|nr:hypothetical protein C0992_006940 [Termitomyces sp. T32_za158]
MRSRAAQLSHLTAQVETHTFLSSTSVIPHISTRRPRSLTVLSYSSSVSEESATTTGMSLRVSKRATVEDKSTKLPVVTEGDLTPEVIKDFEHACLDFFDNKDIKPEDQVKRMLVSFKDHCLHD